MLFEGWLSAVSVRATHKDLAGLLVRRTTLEGKIHRLIDRALDGKIDEKDYDEHRKLLRDDLDDVLIQIERSEELVVDLDAVLSFSKGLLTSLPDCWNRLEWQHRPGFLRALLPQGLTFEDGVIGTTQIPWLFDTFGQDSGANEGWAPPTGFEPVLPP